MKSPPKKECDTCMGYGLWAMGAACAMGPMDARDSLPTLACPECGANANPSKTDHELDAEALYPPEPDIDAHNDKITTMLELVQRNQELKDRTLKLEKELCGMEQAWDDVMERERIALEQNAFLFERVRELEIANEKLHAGGKALLCLFEDLDGCTAKQAEAKITQRLTELVEAFGGE